MGLSSVERQRRYRARHADRIRLRQRARYQRGSNRPHLSEGEKAEARAFYALGLTFKEIGSRLKRTGQTISRCLRETHAIPPRPMKSGPGAISWKGGRVLCKGYVYIWLSPDDPLASMRDKSGRVAEHRLVLARRLGRPLLVSETVHHINGRRVDNRQENLQLRQGRHGKGIAVACLDCGSHRIGPVMLLTTED